MAQVVRKPVLIVLGVSVAVVIAFVAVMSLGFIPGTQEYNMRRAERHGDVLRAKLASDKRFGDVTFGVFTGGPGTGGCLYVSGSVAMAADEMALARTTMDSHPPVPIWWTVHAKEFAYPSGVAIVLETPSDLSKIESQIAEERKWSAEDGK